MFQKNKIFDSYFKAALKVEHKQELRVRKAGGGGGSRKVEESYLQQHSDSQQKIFNNSVLLFLAVMAKL